MANISATPPKRREAKVASEEKGRAASYCAQGAVNAIQPEILQSPPQKSGSMFGQKSFPIKHTFIHYDSPQKTLTISSPPKSVPPNFAPTVVMMRQSQPNFTKGPLPNANLAPPGPMQTLRLSDYLLSPVAPHGSSAGPSGAQGSVSCGVVGNAAPAPVPTMPDFACGQMAQGGGMSGFPPVPPLPGHGQMVGPGVEGNGNGQQTLIMGPCMEGSSCQQMPIGNLDCSQPTCQTVVMAQGIDGNNGQAMMMGPINDGSGNFMIGQMVEMVPQSPAWGDCNGGNMNNGSMFSQCLFQNGMNGVNGQCGVIVEETNALSMPCTPCNGAQMGTPCNGAQMGTPMNGIQVPNGGNAMNSFGMWKDGPKISLGRC